MADSIIYGEIISKDAADQEFGPVLTSVSMESDQLRLLAQKTQNLIMFQILNNVLYVLGDNRTSLYPSGSSITPDIVCSVFSKSKLIELLDNGMESLTAIELRNNVLSITNGSYSLEFGAKCPPFCAT
jgi:hypothetical protein